MNLDWIEQNALLVGVVVLWDLVWKGLALWKASRAGSKWWFIAILVLNTSGLLPIIYIFMISKEEGTL